LTWIWWKRCMDIRSHGHSFPRDFWQGRTFVLTSNDHPGHSCSHQMTTQDIRVGTNVRGNECPGFDENQLCIIDQLYLMSCELNYRPDHCMYMSVCKAAEKTGAVILHGSRRVWFEDKQPAFKAAYKTFKEVKKKTIIYLA